MPRTLVVAAALAATMLATGLSATAAHAQPRAAVTAAVVTEAEPAAAPQISGPYWHYISTYQDPVACQAAGMTANIVFGYPFACRPFEWLGIPLWWDLYEWY